jgi:GW (Gly-Tryp) dipeptide domain
MRSVKIFALMITVLMFASCVKNKNFQNAQSSKPAAGNVIEVKEVVQTSNYSYLKVAENGSEKWVAVTRQEVNAGDVFYYQGSLEMNNFQSKELNRTFETIYFLNQISKTPFETVAAGAMSGGMPAHSGKVDVGQNSAVKLEKGAGEITVAQIFAKRADYAGKEVEIRGIVVKVNKEVMGKNWIHIQDGSNDNGNFDLTVTSLDLAEINDEVTIKGKIILNKDFGSGYSYEVIMEEAKVVTVKKVGATM